jgi:Spy/CpxP family protein refolding chaperone
MNKTKAIFAILLVFILGAVCGALVTHIVYRQRMDAINSGGPGVREEHLVERLTRRLDLDKVQIEQVRAIIHETHSAIREMHRKNQPQVETLIAESQRRISSLLKPEQKSEFDRLIAERKARKHKQ